MKRLILLCSNVAGEAISDYITNTFQQNAGMPGLSVLWQGKTARHDIGSLWLKERRFPNASWI